MFAVKGLMILTLLHLRLNQPPAMLIMRRLIVIVITFIKMIFGISSLLLLCMHACYKNYTGFVKSKHIIIIILIQADYSLLDLVLTCTYVITKHT